MDIGHVIIRQEKLGVPQSSRDVFTLLEQHQWLNAQLADSMKRMIGFRNIAVHDYQALQLPIVISIIEKQLDDFLIFNKVLIARS